MTTTTGCEQKRSENGKYEKPRLTTRQDTLEQRSVNGMSPELREEVACKRRGPLSEIERRSTEEKQRHKIGSSSILSDLDAERTDCFVRYFGAAKRTIAAGVSVGRAKSAETIWDIWQGYCSKLGLDPLVEAVQDKVLARSVEDYIRHVAQTSLSVGSNDPRKRSSQAEIDFRLSRLQAALRFFGRWKSNGCFGVSTSKRHR
ncbi:hypothetical protein THAOC_04325 [Thalassiosira oceanica]|uniref:Uncharacterized protein n=1 Tax=Thalassiosira oceanica TaxID=159749 RepID=K0TA92_THAOC|nr:hypothetical protein THAOC_04325 [Thalassiosira oceanica]|eukprot:EJK74024.1 hypothetical protein THAOC_04325 [Thalassiosira oceanica]